MKSFDYHTLRIGKRSMPELRHPEYLLYWPTFGLVFFLLERVWIRRSYFPISCTLDSLIPFCEYFLIPYLFWFLFLAGMVGYTLLLEPESFERLMKFVMITYTTALLIYMVFPNAQRLRPTSFERDNIFTRFLASFYQFDTSTNVCPSLHVIGSVAVAVTAWHSKRFGTPGWRIAFGFTAALISVSTVFLKQHSVVDVLAAVPVCIAAYYAVVDRRTTSCMGANVANGQATADTVH